MSNRVSKPQRSRKTEERLALASFIEKNGVDSMPCSSCFRANLPCRFATGSSRCAECTRKGRSCDGSSVASSLTKLLNDQAKLEREEAETEKELFVLQTQLQTMVGRLARLRRQKKVLRDRGAEMFLRGVQSLDELEAADRELERVAQGVVNDITSLGADDSVLPSLGLDLPSDWGGLLETSLVAPGNSSGEIPVPKCFPCRHILST